MEKLPFVPSNKARYTKGLARTVVELRREMSISAIAKYFDLHWTTVKEIEKKHLKKKYKNVPLSMVRVIGMDEIYVGKNRYLTVVRDLDSGAVLHVGDGKGADSLYDFADVSIALPAELRPSPLICLPRTRRGSMKTCRKQRLCMTIFISSSS